MSEIVDLIQTWKNVKEEPTNWFYRHGLTVKDGKICEVRQTAEEMGRPAGNVYFVEVAEHLISKAKE